MTRCFTSFVLAFTALVVQGRDETLPDMYVYNEIESNSNTVGYAAARPVVYARAESGGHSSEMIKTPPIPVKQDLRVTRGEDAKTIDGRKAIVISSRGGILGGGSGEFAEQRGVYVTQNGHVRVARSEDPTTVVGSSFFEVQPGGAYLETPSIGNELPDMQHVANVQEHLRLARSEEDSYRRSGSYTIGFHSTSTHARSLYQGCQQNGSKSLSRDYIKGPDFIIAGVQKGGTKSVLTALSEFGCPSAQAEPHFFDSGNFAENQITQERLEHYYDGEWRHCGARRPRFEKSPSYYMQAWAPLRMCESLGIGQKLVFLLRDPIARSYSSFFQSLAATTHLSKSPEGFDNLVTVEVAIVDACGGLPSGDLLSDMRNRSTFEKCCLNVTSILGKPDWPGCTCDYGGAHICGVFGIKSAAQVRMGVYARFLRTYFVYHRVEDMLFYRSEDVFANMPQAIWELLCLTRPSVAPSTVCSASGQHAVGLTVHENSKTEGKPPMLNSTHERLKIFYKPFNEELARLLGRHLHWS